MMQRHTLRAYTLAELMVGIAMFSIVALALQSAVLLASKAIPDAKGVNVNQLAASRTAERITSELSFALTFTELTANAITFTVADRDNDGVDETIRYAWSAVAGQPVTRQYNSGAAASVLDDAREFAVAYDKRAELQATTYTESAEGLLYSYTGALLSGAFNVDKDEWCGQYFMPTLPNGTSSWRVKRIQFVAREGESGNMRVQLRTAAANGTPTNVVVDQQRVYGAPYSSGWGWQEASLANAGGLSPAAGACVVFRGESDTEVDVQYQNLTLALLGGPKYFQTINTGTSFSLNALRALQLRVYGTTTTQDPDLYKYYLASVRLTLRCGPHTAARVHAGARVLSAPEVAGP
ncbi:MAG: type II secretion system protein [Anaerolineae bacterium]|nr:type II secretion system protein [Phycisphaerae bacterium]